MKKYSKEEWTNHTDSITKNKKIINDKKFIKNKIKKSLSDNIKNIKSRFGILFSGGIDSTLLALISRRSDKDFVCYTVGVSGSRDFELVTDIAKEYGLSIKIKIININDVEGVVEDVIKIINDKNINNINIINVGVGCVTYSGLLLAKEDGVKTVVTGLGADELFAGYKEFLDVKDINEHCLHRLKNIYNDLNRDITISNELKVRLVMPYLSNDIVKIAMRTPEKFKISDKIRKLILREIALDFGLDKRYAFIEKRAAQYSSGFDKAINKLAKKDGFSRKKDYLRFVALRPQMVTKI